MNRSDATDRAVTYAEALGLGTLPVQTVRRGRNWWVIALDGGYDLGLIIVKDTGGIHIEPRPFGPWFVGLHPA